MKGDFTRSSFNPEKHYSSVRMQQGRLQLDADWNEQVDILDHLNQVQIRDLIGFSGVSETENDELKSTISPLGLKESLKLKKQNFKISSLNPKEGYFEISPGQIYVDGILCQLEAKIDNTVEDSEPIPTTYLNQPDYPNALQEDLGQQELPEGDYIVYLDVWQRHITSVDDPQIREVALNNVPDTATRTKTVWQVKLLQVLEGDDAQTTWMKFYKRQKKRNIALTPKVSDGANLENHLYRIEIHEGVEIEKKEGETEKKEATFKWSRDNGFIVSAIEKIDGNIITIRQNNNEAWQLAKPRQWVEIIRSDQTENWELAGKPGILVRLQRVSGNKLIIDLASLKKPLELTLPKEFDQSKESSFYKIRLWDYTIDTGEKAGIPIPSDNTGYIPLEGEGIEIKFTGNDNYHTGDYWLIPTRKNRLNPLDLPTKGEDSASYQDLPPNGIEHHYTCLALIKFTSNQELEVRDCRQSFLSLINVLERLEGRNIDELNVGQLQIKGQEATEAKGTISKVSSDVLFRYAGEGFEELSVGDTIIVSEPSPSIDQQVRTITKIEEGQILTVNKPFEPPLDNLNEQKFFFQKPLALFLDNSGENQLIVNGLGLDVKGKIAAQNLELTEETSTFKVNTILSNELGIGVDNPDRLQADLQIESGSDQRAIALLKDSSANTQLIVTAEGNVAIGKEIPTDGSKLDVEGKIKATELELPPEGTFEAGTFKGNSLELGIRQDQNSFSNYGLIQAEEVDGSKQISFTVENNVPFAFLNGKVVIGEPNKNNNNALLNVGGIVSATQFIGDGSELTGITAEQVGALVSVDGLSNPGGNIDLISSGAITIEASPENHQITIGETHSVNQDNPHQVTAEQVGAIASVDGVSNPGGNIDLIQQAAITITPNDANNQITIGETHSSRTDNPHQVTALDIGAISTAGGTVEGPLTLLDNLNVNGNIALGTDQGTANLHVQGSDADVAPGTISSSSVVTVLGNGTTFATNQEGSSIIAANEIKRITQVISTTEIIVELPFSQSLSGETFAVVPVQAVTISPSSSSQTTINIDGDIPAELTENVMIIAAGQIRKVLSIIETSNGETINQFTIDLAFKEPLAPATPFAILQPEADITVSGWDAQNSRWHQAIATVEGVFPSDLAEGDFVIAAGQLRTVETIARNNNSFIVTPPFREPLPSETNLFILSQQSGTIRTEITVTGDADVDFNQLHVGDFLDAEGQRRLIAGISIADNQLTIPVPFDPPLTNATFSYQQPIAQFLDSQEQPQLMINAEGNIGIGTSIPKAKLQVEGSVRINDDLWCNGTLLQSSSRALKNNIAEISRQEASQILRELNPIKFNYKKDRVNHPHIGFIAEDVPDLVASSDKKAIFPVDIIAVLTKTVQYHQQTIAQLTNLVDGQKQEIAILQENLTRLSEVLQKKDSAKKRIRIRIKACLKRRLAIRSYLKQLKSLFGEVSSRISRF